MYKDVGSFFQREKITKISLLSEREIDLETLPHLIHTPVQSSILNYDYMIIPLITDVSIPPNSSH